MQKHFVTFLSPGTFFDEEATREVPSWDVTEAMKMAHGIVARYEATPFAFRFSTRSRSDKDLDSTTTARSQLYYLGGRIETREEIERRNDPKEDILRFNLRANKVERVIVNDNSFRVCRELHDGDVILDWKPAPKKPKTAA